MTAYAAFRLGLRVHVMERTTGSPAGQIAHLDLAGDPSNHELLIRFAADCDVVTLESEFVNESHLAMAEKAGAVVLPSPASIGLIQDKLTQKTTASDVGVPTAPFASIDTHHDAIEFGTEHGYPFLLKTRRDGYDGYGNTTIHTPDQIATGWARIARGNADVRIYAEAFVPFRKELAIMVARSRSGEIVLYPVVETIQHNHICHYVLAPASVDVEVARQVAALARTAVEAIEGVGIFGVELFLCDDGTVLFNEMAPRPHNSGHYTIEGCVTSQFENHIRAVMGWPLGSSNLLAPAVVMANVLGRSDASGVVSNYEAILEEPGAHLHIYAKGRERRGRKMGHVTALADSLDEAMRVARSTEERVRFGGDARVGPAAV